MFSGGAKSQTRYVFVLNGGAVDCKSAKQSIIATSSREAEYMAASEASKEAVWITNEPGITKGAKHYRTKIHYLHEVIKLGDIVLDKVHTNDNVADPFTKALPFNNHSSPTKSIGLLPASILMVHSTFHVSNLKKCLSDEPLAIPLDEIHINDKLHFVEKPVEIMDREVKWLKQSRIPIIKVRWNSKKGPEFTWEREDQFRKKYSHLFTKTAPSASAVS
ncbi:hypothetical protein Tco_1016726 [Tanacetum coccineum]|uniref:Reverse transcriptase domain-containing protein n=1 Tax=Tanacetum coccineum TaxID=301880 RepID=A0ABQ5FPF6_9ASTR